MKKKRGKWLLIIILALIGIFSFVILLDSNLRFVVRETFFPTSIFSYKRSSVEDFHSYRKDYKVIKNVCMDYYDSIKEEEDNFFLTEFNGNNIYLYNYKEKTLPSKTRREKLPCQSQKSGAIKRL
jgi:hypothetical protein